MTTKIKSLVFMLAFIGLSSNVLNAQTWNIGSPTPTNVTATLSGGTLTISGTGAMENWSAGTAAPWYPSRASINMVVINSGVTTIGDWAFAACASLTSVAIPNGVTTIGTVAFASCISLTSIAIPNGVTAIGNEAFRHCSGLNSVAIPNSVATIGDDAFNNCTSLNSVAIGVATIGVAAFANCTGLTIIYANAATPPSIQSTTFFNVPLTVPVIVPCGSSAAYVASAPWNSFNYLFAYCDIVALRTDTATYKGQIADLQSDLSTCDDEKEALKLDTAALQAKVTGLEGDTATYKGQITGLQDDLSNCGDEKAAIQQQLDDCLNGTGVVETQLIASLRIFPNPVNDELRIMCDDCEVLSVEITDISGRNVGALRATPLHDGQTINVSSLPAGVYLIKILTDKGTRTERFIKN